MEPASRRRRLSPVSITRISALGLAIGLLTGCSGPTETSGSPLTTASPSSVSARELCSSAIGPQATVTAAYPTTVRQVRERHHSATGTPPVAGTSPVDGYADWDALTADTSAAWCAIKAGTQGYEVTAIAQGARMVTFETSTEPMDPGPNGPGIP